MDPSNFTTAQYLQLLGLGGSTEILDPKVFLEGGGKDLPKMGLHLVYDNPAMSAARMRQARTNNREASEAFERKKNLLLEPDAKAIFLYKSDNGEVEAAALTNPHAKGRPVSRLIGTEYKLEYLEPEPWCPHGAVNAVDYEVDVQLPPGEDPHIVFLAAAHNLRDVIAADTEALTKGLSSNAVLVTTVFTPIVAMPKPDQGFYLHCSIGQMVVVKSTIVQEGEPINRNGTIPIETPNTVAMKMLVHMDKELEQMGVLTADRNTPKVLPADALKEAHRRSANAGFLKNS